MNRHIKQVAILGSGVMGSRIACHFANIGCEVLLLDIVPKEHLEIFEQVINQVQLLLDEETDSSSNNSTI